MNAEEKSLTVQVPSGSVGPDVTEYTIYITYLCML